MAQGSGMLRNGHFAYGTGTGTGAAIAITTGFQPVYVKVLNTGGNCSGEWVSGMTAAHVQKIVDSGSGTTDISEASSGGITVNTSGFSIGADTDLNVSGEAYAWIAIG